MKPGSRFPYVTTETPQMCFTFGFSDGKIMLCLCRESRTITRVLVTETRKPRVGQLWHWREKMEGSYGVRGREAKAASPGWPKVHLAFSVTPYGKS